MKRVVEDSKKSTVLQYGQLAMRYTKTKDPSIASQLREIERSLGLRPEEVMDLVIEYTGEFSHEK